MNENAIALTGATGLLGTEVLNGLKESHQIYALDRRHSDRGSNRATSSVVDLSMAADLELPDGIGTVIHLAQSRLFREFPEHAGDVFGVNAASTARLVEAAHRVGARHFILASTGSVYRPSISPISETDPLEDHPESFYAATKRCAELLVGAYKNLLSSITILRFFYIYGRHQSKEMLIPRLVSSVVEGRRIRLWGDQGMLINPVHVSDAARAVISCLKLGGEHVINVAGAETLSLRTLAERIGTIVGSEPRFEVVDGGDQKSVVGSIDKMSALLGPPQMSLQRGLEDLCR